MQYQVFVIVLQIIIKYTTNKCLLHILHERGSTSRIPLPATPAHEAVDLHCAGTKSIHLIMRKGTGRIINYPVRISAVAHVPPDSLEKPPCLSALRASFSFWLDTESAHRLVCPHTALSISISIFVSLLDIAREKDGMK